MKFYTPVFLLAALSAGVSSCKGVTLVPCGGLSSSKQISLVNPKSPPNECKYEISAYSKKVCQVRIDFSMSLAQPDLPSAKNGLDEPECVSDVLMIGDRKFCGSENSQHLYIQMNKTAGITSLDISIKSTPRSGLSKLPPLSWDIQLTQLECTSSKDEYLLAPAGCDQFFYEEEGTIESFNYNDGEGIYPHNLNYVMCFTRNTATTGLLIQANDFNLGKNGDETTTVSQTDGQCYPQLRNEGAVEDYLMIPQAQVVENDVRATYFCGDSLNGLSALSSYPGPLSMVFNSGGAFEKGTKSKGFSLNYEIVSEC